MIPDESVRVQLRDKWQDARPPKDVNSTRWKQLKQLLESGKQKGFALRRCVEEIIFSYTYPRLDLEVSKSMNHLLKSPFCIHPKTGRVCIPIDPKTCETFNPMEVPTISQLLNELNQEDKPSKEIDSSLLSKDWERTSLAKPIHYFQSSFLEPLLRASKAELESAHRAKLQELATTPSLQW